MILLKTLTHFILDRKLVKSRKSSKIWKIFI